MKNEIIRCKDLIKIYESTASSIKVPALRGVDLSIKEGDLITIIGPSGAGKTTLISMIGMLDRVSSGEIIFDQEKIGKFNYSETSFKRLVSLRSQIFGFLFQEPSQNLLYNLSAIENVIFPMKLLGKLTREERRKKATELLKTLNIHNRSNHKPPQLSGGEAQRLGICAALANDPLVILADEPTGELDSLNTISIIKYFHEINRELGNTFLIVTHDHRFERMTDITYRITDGRVSSLYKLKMHDDLSNRQEFTYVTKDGNLQIPKELLEQYNIKNAVKLEGEKDFIKIIPVKDVYNNKNTLNKKNKEEI